MFGIYNQVYELEGQFGYRYRRKDGVYLLFEIIESHYKDNKVSDH